MKKFEGTRYNSKWDISTWLIIAIVAAGCAIPCFLDDGIWPTIISLAMLVFRYSCFPRHILQNRRQQTHSVPVFHFASISN